MVQTVTAIRNVYALLLTVCFSLSTFVLPIQAQSLTPEQVFDYADLKGLLLKHKTTVGRMLGMNGFLFVSSKQSTGSTIYAYEYARKRTQVLVRVRERDGLVDEIAWDQHPATIGNLTHDAVHDGFVPVAGNSRYVNRFQKMALLINYGLAYENSVVPCVLRAVE